MTAKRSARSMVPCGQVSAMQQLATVREKEHQQQMQELTMVSNTR